jgi:hypothetical protein
MVAISEESQKGTINLRDFYNWVTFDGRISTASRFVVYSNIISSSR